MAPAETNGAASGSEAVVSQLFSFQHPVFKAPQARFMLGSDGVPVMGLMLDAQLVSMTIRSLYGEFIKEGTPDDQMLKTVIASLKFVKVIRPGDSVPREILDGTASWAVQDHHFEMAKGRLSVEILSWLRGQEVMVPDRESLLQLAADPRVKQRINDAFGDIAVKLGLRPDQKQEVIDRIERIARELAYIEALRERVGALPELFEKIVELFKQYKRERNMSEEIQRILSLMRRPIQDMNDLFDQIDAACGEIIPLLRNIRNQIEYIRGMRDELHVRLMTWDEVLNHWQKIRPERVEGTDQELRNLYRFLAQKFIVRKEWELSDAKYRKTPPRPASGDGASLAASGEEAKSPAL